MSGTEALREILADSTASVLTFTGAGISAGAGLPTYRGPGGIYPAGVIPLHASDARSKNLPALWERLLPLASGARAATPTRAHKALARLTGSTVITQNVDGLHESAGSDRVLAMHGSLARVRCSQPGTDHRTDLPGDEEFAAALRDGNVPRCAVDRSRLRPDIVLFGENLDRDLITAAATSAAKADAILVIGTSLQVHPVAGFVTRALNAGAVGAWFDSDPARALNHVDTHDYASFARLTGVSGDVQRTVPALIGLRDVA